MVLLSPYTHNEVSVDFEFQKSRKSTAHLIVVFTSIRKNPIWLDFDPTEGLLKQNRANILWIHDNFGGEYSYYSFINRESLFQHAVASLIDTFRIKLGLSYDQCTAVGMSKGGSAAILIGLKCNFSNIVALVPQIAIGSYLRDSERDGITRHMAGDTSSDSLKWLDGLVPSAIEADQSRARNIYIITSPHDTHCIDFIEPLLPYLDNYDNFNLISTYSDDATNHGLTLRFNVPLVINLLGILSNGLRPSFGGASNGNGPAGIDNVRRFRLVSNRFGGVLVDSVDKLGGMPNRDSSGEFDLLSRKLASAEERADIQTAKISRMQQSKLGRFQQHVWRFRRRFFG